MARRRFQSHLGRWDWEPYGLLLRRDALEQLGARPVIYGDDQTYKQMSDVDRPFFQPARRRSAHSSEDHWQAEKEWRVLSDIHLTELPPAVSCCLLKQPHRRSSWPRITPGQLFTWRQIEFGRSQMRERAGRVLLLEQAETEFSRSSDF